MSKRAPERSWYSAAAERMVRGGLSLRQAAQELDISLTVEEADTISKQKAWQDVLWATRHKFNAEIAANPGRNKASLLGQMYLCIQELLKAGEWDKAIDALQKVSKIEGWDKSSEINIFAGITSADIDLERKKIEAEIKSTDEPKSIN